MCRLYCAVRRVIKTGKSLPGCPLPCQHGHDSKSQSWSTGCSQVSVIEKAVVLATSKLPGGCAGRGPVLTGAEGSENLRDGDGVPVSAKMLNAVHLYYDVHLISVISYSVGVYNDVHLYDDDVH